MYVHAGAKLHTQKNRKSKEKPNYITTLKRSDSKQREREAGGQWDDIKLICKHVTKLAQPTSPFRLSVLSSIRPKTSAWRSDSRSHGRLFVVLGVQNFLSTHGADAFLVSTALAVMGPWLVDRALTDPADSKASLAVGVKPGLLGCQHLVLVEFTPSTLCRIPGPILPGVRGDDLTQLLLTFLTHHLVSSMVESRCFCW